MKYLISIMLNFLVIVLLVTSCAQAPSSVLTPSAPLPGRTAQPDPTGTVGSPAPTSAVTQGRVYTDAKLGFQLTMPTNWQAQPQPGSQTAPDNAAVTFIDNQQHDHALVVIGVFHGTTMGAAFAARGTPTARIGPYPAFVADRTLGEARAPCLVRIFLAGDDYVLADWCAPDAFSHRAQFEQFLATYRPAPSSFFAPRSTVAALAQTCAGMQHQLGYAGSAWGSRLATPTSAGWREIKTGIFICSNDESPDWYLFQCTELANRFLYERWALPHIPGNAARYFDYYQDGRYYPGTVRTFPAGSYQLSSDASQGKSAFRPVAGDLLIFQDVNSPRQGWTSGLIDSPGHVAVIVGVDATHVYIAQENYNDAQYFLALPLRTVANGYEITDLSGWSKRIVRGWIHFTANGGPVSIA